MEQRPIKLALSKDTWSILDLEKENNKLKYSTYIRGLILMEQGDTTAAVASFQKALDVALGQESK